MKVFDALQDIYALTQEEGLLRPVLCRRLLKVVTRAYRNPSNTCARLSLEGQSYTSPRFRETPWSQSADIRNGDKVLGELLVCFRADPRQTVDAAVLRAEQAFLKAAGQAIGTGLEMARLRSALPLSEASLRNVIERAAEGMLVVDRAGNIVFANPAAQRLLRRSSDALHGQPLGFPVVPGEWTDVEIVRADGTLAILELRAVETDWFGVSSYVVSMHDVTERLQREHERAENLKRLHRIMLQTVEAVARTIEKRDPFTGGHHLRVAGLAVAIGREMGLPPEDVESLRLGAFIHDIGNATVPAEILSRPGLLTGPEFALVKDHAVMGYEILKDLELLQPIARMVLQHHERLDGSGYPVGLKGEAICMGARVLAVADVVVAMASHRPYRPAYHLEEALAEIERFRGTRYDPDVVDACIRLIMKKGFILSDDTAIKEVA